jgi:hypothetical protein
MKRSIFDPAVRQEVVSRVATLKPDTRPRWGKLSAPQMIRHLTEACKMAFDEVVIPEQSTFFTRTLGRWLFLNNIKPPGREKGTIKTFPQIDIVALNTQVDDIEKEKEMYAAMLERTNSTQELSKQHPLLGKMTREDWGYLDYAHADYHLTQFGV